jgi:hypothetical protein
VLRIRFCWCEFRDGTFASFLRALGEKSTLKVLEFGFDANVELGAPELSIAAIHGLIESNSSLEELAVRGLGADAVVALLRGILPSFRTLAFFGADLADDVWERIRAPLLAALQTNGVLFHLGEDLTQFWDYRRLAPPSKVLVKVGIERHGRKAIGTDRGPPNYRGAPPDRLRALGSPPSTRPDRRSTQLFGLPRLEASF